MRLLVMAIAMMRQIMFTAYMMALTAVGPMLMQRFALIAHVMVSPSSCKSSFFYGQTFSTFDSLLYD